MNRRSFQELARTRLQDVEALIKARRYSAAYYLCGYVIECTLKACIAKKTKRFDFPDKRVVQDIYTHNLEQLVKAAGLENERKVEGEPFQKNWAIVKDWSEHSRYDIGVK
jgi:hypothetical protein